MENEIEIEIYDFGNPKSEMGEPFSWVIGFCGQKNQGYFFLIIFGRKLIIDGEIEID